mgnify:CR=1 FL=1
MTSTVQSLPIKPLDIDTYIEDIIRHICDLDNSSGLLTDSLNHHFQAGGSRTRARLCYNFSTTLGLSHQQAGFMAAVPELLHNASLIHDDLQDKDEKRRNRESLWKKFGPDVAICAGDYLISAAYSALAQTGVSRMAGAMELVHTHVAEVIRGQVEDLSQDKNQTLHDLQVYEAISAEKSGALLAMCLTLPLRTQGHTDLEVAARLSCKHFAVAYQICDDLADIEIDQGKKGQKSGLNIYTILQLCGSPGPFEAARDMALKHLTLARKESRGLPEGVAELLLDELQATADKIKTIEKS